MPVTLESRLRRMQVFNLPHVPFCRAQCACSQIAVTVLEENPRTGERAPRRTSKQVPGSLTLLARERKAGLPSVLLEVPEIRAAISRGHVRVVEQVPDPSPTAVAAAVAATPMPHAVPEPAPPPKES